LGAWAVAFGAMTQTEFLESLPLWIFATNNPAKGAFLKPRDAAVSRTHIQPNPERARSWLLFDLDRDDSYFLPEERDLPEPTFIAVNRANGHAHVGYMISGCVTLYENSRQQPISLFRDVERGMSMRLGADFSYNHRVCKNPLHKQWETDWQAAKPYDLGRLADFLTSSEKKASKGLVIGVGRNCTIFDRLRQDAYREVLDFKKSGRSEADFRALMESDALRMNSKFAAPLVQSEVKGIAKSVSKWVWEKFSVKAFSERQSARVKKRWSKVQTLAEMKPWEKEGVSRATWYRRRTASGTLS
jgi:hypothetical protein